MPDYSGMSDSDLMALVKPSSPAVQDYSKLSNDDLMKVINPQSPSMLGDMAKSFGGGLVQGTSGILSNVGQAAQLEMGQPVNVGSPQETQKVIEQNLTGPVHAPQTVGGRFAQSVGQALPYGLTQPIASVGGLASALGGSALSGAGAQAGSELTPDLPNGTQSPLAPYARAVGSMAAPWALNTASKFVTPFPASQSRLNASSYLNSQGITPSAGQTVGRDSLMRIEHQLGGSSVFDKAAEDYTQAALSKAGAKMGPNDTLSDALNNGFKNNSDQYNSLAANNPKISIDTNAKLDALQHLHDYTQKVEGAGPAPIVSTYTERIANSSGMSGGEYQNLRSEIGRNARGVTNNPNLQQSLYNLQGTLDDAAERSIAQTNPSDLGKWQQARQQYRNLLVLQNAAGKGGQAVAENSITPGNLKSSADAIYGKSAYARGQGDFTDLAKSGYILTPPKSSGTAENIAAQNLHAGIPALAGGWLGAGAAAGAVAPGLAGFHGPEFSLPGAALGAYLPYAAGRAMMSTPAQSYLANQLISPYKSEISEVSKRAMLNALLGQNSQLQSGR